MKTLRISALVLLCGCGASSQSMNTEQAARFLAGFVSCVLQQAAQLPASQPQQSQSTQLAPAPTP